MAKPIVIVTELGKECVVFHDHAPALHIIQPYKTDTLDYIELRDTTAQRLDGLWLHSCSDNWCGEVCVKMHIWFLCFIRVHFFCFFSFFPIPFSPNRGSMVFGVSWFLGMKLDMSNIRLSMRLSFPPKP